MKRFNLKLAGVFAAVVGLFWAGSAFAMVPEAPQIRYSFIENRTLIWIAAQMHILFAAFILGAPIFCVISEWLGMRKGDPRYDRLAREVIKVTAILYSMTALTGGLLILFLIGLYPALTTYLVGEFFPIFGILYPLLFIVETIVLYTYWYTWDTLTGPKKARHVALGVLLNVVGLATLMTINAPTSFMNTPPTEGVTGIWDLINNHSWMPLNFHRIIGNITFGGFITGLIAAYLYMFAKTKEEKAYYDWMGFVGNMIGVGALLLLPLAGYILAAEFFDFDASIGPYMMADQLSMYFEMQGALVGMIFMASNLYIWLSMKRITGIEKVKFLGIPCFTVVKMGFIVILFGNAIWMTPHGFAATQFMATEATELPSEWGWLALMPAKNTAALMIVLMTILNYFLYNRAIRQGTIQWGKINFLSQFVLMFLAFSVIWTMGLMGTVRSLVRKYFHVYIKFPDFTAEAYTPTLAHTSMLVTMMTLAFFAVVSLAIWLSLMTGKSKSSG